MPATKKLNNSKNFLYITKALQYNLWDAIDNSGTRCPEQAICGPAGRKEFPVPSSVCTLAHRQGEEIQEGVPQMNTWLTWQMLGERWHVSIRQARRISKALGIVPIYLAPMTPRFPLSAVIKAEAKAK